MSPLLRRLASLRLTVALLLLAAAVLGWRIAFDEPVAVPLAILFAAMAVNLLAAIAVHPGLRSRMPLLVFHLALAGMAALAAVGRLGELQGHVEVAEGTAFDPDRVVARAGPWHPWSLDRIGFVQGRFTVDYEPGVRRRGTASQVLLRMPDGSLEAHTVGDDRPLVVDGYRFYTSFNKGFAPLLEYRTAGGHALRGLVHLPSWPLNMDMQGNSWELPDGAGTVAFWLEFDEPPVHPDRSWTLNSAAAYPARLIVRHEGRRYELRPGERAPLAGGELAFLGLRGWMGYTISYDPTRLWLLATALVALVALAVHTLGRAFAPAPASVRAEVAP